MFTLESQPHTLEVGSPGTRCAGWGDGPQQSPGPGPGSPPQLPAVPAPCADTRSSVGTFLGLGLGLLDGPAPWGPKGEGLCLWLSLGGWGWVISSWQPPHDQDFCGSRAERGQSQCAPIIPALGQMVLRRPAPWPAARRPSPLKASWRLPGCRCWPALVPGPMVEPLRMVMDTGWHSGLPDLGLAEALPLGCLSAGGENSGWPRDSIITTCHSATGAGAFSSCCGSRQRPHCHPPRAPGPAAGTPGA